MKSIQIQILLVILGITVVSAQNAINSVTLKSGFSLKYQIIKKDADDDSVRFWLTSNKPGYVSLGFGNSMTNLDLFAGMFNAGKATAKDYKANGNVTPIEDATNDVTVVETESKRGDSSTTICVDRKLNTGDSNDKVLTIGTAFDISYAWGNTDSFVNHMGNYGTSSLTLSKTDSAGTPSTSNSSILFVSLLMCLLISIL